MQYDGIFESLTVSRDDFAEKSPTFTQMKSLIDAVDVKIVHIKRNRDRLTIIFRKIG
ncbi:hypothetical protein [Alicyclobacillus sp. SO9]|uniref:hypothetical protein n=1 Tax=Alicyclobacillus sp. SO9 TaxID=2665646 RepID=UPI0018E87C37|nr:hypothetical protein [Alicyclobacillus sp. SO9]QQE77711.1 hypothetical protein GI364_17490 [Alicyclobacillus sp. SO9]